MCFWNRQGGKRDVYKRQAGIEDALAKAAEVLDSQIES